MRNFAIHAVLLAAVIGCAQPAPTTPMAEESGESSQSAEATQVAFNTEGAPTVDFSVPQMMCEFSCAPTVRKTLAAQPGVKDVKVDLESKTATVAVDEDQFDAEAAVAALVDMQFTETQVLAKNSDVNEAAEPAAIDAAKSDKAS